MPVKLFFCYAHEDEALLNKLKSHLRPLQRQGLIDIWYDRDISAGMEWEQEISKHLNEADIILLLISPDFMDSDYCYSIEMKRALERHEKRDAQVIPVILRSVYWQGLLGKLQALPTDALPIMSSNWHTIDDAFFDVVIGIRKAIERFFPQELQQGTLVQEFDLSLPKKGGHANMAVPYPTPPPLSVWQTNVFILGRPGSGKTTAIRYLTQELEKRGWFTSRINEYEILRNMFQTDLAKQKFIATEHGGFDILDFSIFSEASKEIERTIQKLASYKKIILVELARDEYKRAFRQFDTHLVQDSYFLFIDADVETCVRRIHQRVLHPETPDDYFVSDTMLRRYYHKDNWEYMAHQFHRDFAIMKNVLSVKNMGSQQEFLERVKLFAKLIDDRQNNLMSAGDVW